MDNSSIRKEGVGHTPGPWELHGASPRLMIEDKDGFLIAEIPVNYQVHGRTQIANARRIVQCVNGWDALVVACNRALSVIGSLHSDGTDPYVLEAEASIRAALKASEDSQ